MPVKLKSLCPIATVDATINNVAEIPLFFMGIIGERAGLDRVCRFLHGVAAGAENAGSVDTPRSNPYSYVLDEQSRTECINHAEIEEFLHCRVIGLQETVRMRSRFDHDFKAEFRCHHTGGRGHAIVSRIDFAAGIIDWKSVV